MANPQRIIAALADPTRRRIIEALRDGEKTVTELAARTPVTRSAVSQHLTQMKAVHLVEDRREGTRRYYRLQADALGELRAYVDALWTDALAGFAARKGTRHGR